jgi:hypothetical protein
MIDKALCTNLRVQINYFFPFKIIWTVLELALKIRITHQRMTHNSCWKGFYFLEPRAQSLKFCSFAVITKLHCQLEQDSFFQIHHIPHS